MKLYKVICRDIQANPYAGLVRTILAALLFSFLFVSFYFEVFHYFPVELGSPINVNQLGLSLGDLIMVETGGALPRYNAMYEKKHLFPVAFFLVHILPCCFTLNFSHDDINQGGIQVFTRLGNMNTWWYSKCLWNGITVASYYLVGFFIWLVLCHFSGKSLSLLPNSNVFLAFFAAYFTNEKLSSMDLFPCMIVLPVLVTITLSLCQMTLTLFTKPILAFFATCLYFILGFYCIHPAFLTSYAMPVRNAMIGVYNFDTLFGIGLCSIICALAIYIGKLRLCRFDIVGER